MSIHAVSQDVRWRRVAVMVVTLTTLMTAAWQSSILAAEAAPATDETSLDRYVAEPDGSYSWKVAATHQQEGATVYIVDLKSQTWRNSTDVDRTLWEHWLVVVRPKEVTSSTGFLFIGGGRNGSDPPGGADDFILNLARDSKSVVAELKQVPNQPLVFDGDGHNRSEDDLIAYTWDKFIKGGDDRWPARLPMVKSAVRAMDTVQALIASPEGGASKVEKFVVSGGSKRGWTTWCTAAVDKRVTAIVPCVIDVLNVRPSMEHHYSAYGFWAPAVGDYQRHKIMDRRDHPNYIKLLGIEDPYSYRARYTMPKFIVNAANDEFFLPDSSQFYYNDLPGEKHLRYVPNSGHSLGGSDARQSIEAFYLSVVEGKARPKYQWTFESDGSIRVVTSDKPREVKLWAATNPNARDFRLAAVGKEAYKASLLEPADDGVYFGRVDKPAKGFTAYFVELTYDAPGKYPYKFTSGVRVSPDELPHEGKLPPSKND
ncbi:MAG: PhoPQ-activated pathogenicity-related family protein [Pirellulales bacterium]|nr:PhoPQ-activated pathogenicity-related family protein [Pirellulales bacterium]